MGASQTLEWPCGVALAFDLQIESTGFQSGRSVDLQIDDAFRLRSRLDSSRKGFQRIEHVECGDFRRFGSRAQQEPL